MRLSRKIASSILIVLVSISVYYSVTESKHIHISNDTRCRITLENITTKSGWPTWFTSKFDPEIGWFQVINIRHLGHHTEFLITVIVDGSPQSFLYNSFEKSFQSTGDSAMPNDGRLHLDITNTSCKLPKE